jgi:hypothetical protein
MYLVAGAVLKQNSHAAEPAYCALMGVGYVSATNITPVSFMEILHALIPQVVIIYVKIILVGVLILAYKIKAKASTEKRFERI